MHSSGDLIISRSLTYLWDSFAWLRMMMSHTEHWDNTQHYFRCTGASHWKHANGSKWVKFKKNISIFTSLLKKKNKNFGFQKIKNNCWESFLFNVGINPFKSIAELPNSSISASNSSAPDQLPQLSHAWMAWAVVAGFGGWYPTMLKNMWNFVSPMTLWIFCFDFWIRI